MTIGDVDHARRDRSVDREFRKVLRESGFTNSQAEAIATLGFKEWSRRETGASQADNRAEWSALAERLNGFSLPTFR